MAFLDRFSEAIQEVMVVPRSAPIAKAMAVCHGSTPEAPRPITMPMVADEDWMTPVMAVPAIRPLTGVPAILAGTARPPGGVQWGMPHMECARSEARQEIR